MVDDTDERLDNGYSFHPSRIHGEPQSAAERARRENYLEEIRSWVKTEADGYHADPRVSKEYESWLDWLEGTGELPPDFERMPARGGLPNPLQREVAGDWTRVADAETWELQRSRLKHQLQYWIYGELPPAPEAMDATVLDTRDFGGATARDVRLAFGPDNKASLHLELLVPDGEGPFPVFLTQWNHRKWAEIALERGYIAVRYAGADKYDDAADYRDQYPAYDFQLLARRAWAAQRAVDYLYSLPEADEDRIGLAGHSRNGKQVLIAAAFDDRIDAVVPSSAGSGGVIPARLDRDDYHAGDASFHARLRRSWFHPRWRFFIGRENRLPVDANSLVSLVAPRACMLFTATHEATSSSGAVGRVSESVMDVYELLGVPSRFRLKYRSGDHGTATRDIHTIVDFFDYAFSRRDSFESSRRHHGFDFDDWVAAADRSVNTGVFPVRGLSDLLIGSDGDRITAAPEWETAKADVQDRIRWSLGERPPRAPPRSNAGRSGVSAGYGRRDYITDIIGRPEPTQTRGRLWLSPYHTDGKPFGGELYYPRPAESDTPNEDIPAVIWLHPFSFNTGYGTAARSQVPVDDAIDRSLALFTYDQIGFGTRIAEAQQFYDRYPDWSKMGKMVADVQSAVRTLTDVDFVDTDKIYLLGYSLGATVGLYAAALSEEIAGVASVCGVPPLRASVAETERASATRARLVQHYGLQPRLGHFQDCPERIPYDFHEVLAAIAPRPLLVRAPTHDWTHPHGPVRERVNSARKIYSVLEAEDQLTFDNPHDFLSFDYHEARLAGAAACAGDEPPLGTPRRDTVFEWIAKQATR